MGSVIQDISLFITHARKALIYGVAHCAKCGFPYVKTKVNGKYCSRKCYYRAANSRKLEKT